MEAHKLFLVIFCDFIIYIVYILCFQWVRMVARAGAWLRAWPAQHLLPGASRGVPRCGSALRVRGFVRACPRFSVAAFVSLGEAVAAAMSLCNGKWEAFSAGKERRCCWRALRELNAGVRTAV